jgi:hypothetical protein
MAKGKAGLHPRFTDDFDAIDVPDGTPPPQLTDENNNPVDKDGPVYQSGWQAAMRKDDRDMSQGLTWLYGYDDYNESRLK